MTVQPFQMITFVPSESAMLRRIFSISLAIVVLLSSTGYGFSAHLCGGKAVSFSLFGQPGGCSVQEDRHTDEPCRLPSSASETCSLQAKKCCSEQTVVVPGIQHLAESAKHTMTSPGLIAPAFEYFGLLPRSVFASSLKPRFSGYHPFVRALDLSVLLRVFRI